MYIIDDDYSGRSWNNSTRLIKRYTNAIDDITLDEINQNNVTQIVFNGGNAL